MPKIVKVLELLERFASWNQVHKLQEVELLKTFETLQLQQHKKRGPKDIEETNYKHEDRVRYFTNVQVKSAHNCVVTLFKLCFSTGVMLRVCLTGFELTVCSDNRACPPSKCNHLFI